MSFNFSNIANLFMPASSQSTATQAYTPDSQNDWGQIQPMGVITQPPVDGWKPRDPYRQPPVDLPRPGLPGQGNNPQQLLMQILNLLVSLIDMMKGGTGNFPPPPSDGLPTNPFPGGPPVYMPMGIVTADFPDNAVIRQV